MDARPEALRRRIGELGFDEVRFAALSPPLPGRPLRSWLEAGHHADMDWMERTASKRTDPGLVLEAARSAILLGVNYLGEDPAGGPRDGGRPIWARYSLFKDYHDTVKPALVQAGRVLEELFGAGPEDYRYYVDTGPVLERAWAARAGIGFVGKNAMLISRRHGNWLLLSAILTRQELPADPPVRLRTRDTAGIGLLCGKCTRCIDACPTQAFPEPGVVDSRRCISYQTIENKGTIPRELRPHFGLRVFGCDACLDACPWNRFARQGRRQLLAARPHIAQIPLRELLEMTRERFTEVFRGTPIKRVKHSGLLRNACVAAGNSGDPTLLPALVRLASDGTPLVRAHAVWAVRRLGGSSLLATARAGEADPTVLAEFDAPDYHASPPAS